MKSLHVSSTFKCPLCNQDHGIYNCKNFLEMPNDQKLRTVNKLKLCANCLFSHNGNPCISTRTCRKCTDQHNTLLHDAYNQAMPTATPKSLTSKKQNETSSHVSQNNYSEVLLATAILKVKAADGTFQQMRALIDQGSQISLISENAAQRLCLKRQKCKGTIFGVGQQENTCKGVINIECASLYNDFTFNAEVLIMNNLIKNLPNKTFNKPSWNFISNINLADPEFYTSRPVDILLGADVYSRILLSGIIKVEDSTAPIAQQTELGWLLCGHAKTSYQCNVIMNNTETIERFWEIEEITESASLSVEDQECINFYNTTTVRKEDGRYEVRLPLKPDIQQKLGSSKQMAVAQFRNLEKRFEKHEQLSKDYKEFMNEYETLNHMKPDDEDIDSYIECYLPHHGVHRSESSTTKYRVVFNASAPTSSGYTLNDLMYAGPNLQQDLQILLIKWRQYRYAFTADIEKMYRQTLINKQDQNLQKIVWRENSRQPLKTYKLATVTYGTKAAPFLAMMTLRKLATDEQNNFPIASKVLTSSFFVDDLVHGSGTIEQGKQLISELRLLLQKGGMNLRKWSSNNSDLLSDLQKGDNKDENKVFNFKTGDTSKTLGLCWNSSSDQFTFNYQVVTQNIKPTKRCLLSDISKLFDPLGWLAPLSTKLKLLFQSLWKLNLKWDDTVPDDIYKEWSKLKADIHLINSFEIPRWLLCSATDVIQLHGFCDASEKAYACVVYARIHNNLKSIIVAAKSKLVPHKKALSLPKLELSGALLLSKLIDKIKTALNQHQIEFYCWTDSMAVLGWIQGEPNRWKPFVANRVEKITKIIPSNDWRYVRSNENPADAASRGLYASQIKDNVLWWDGPSWLPLHAKEHLEQRKYDTNLESRKNINQSNIIQTENRDNIINNILNNYSSITKCIRIVAWLQRALNPQRKQLPQYITLQELEKAKLTIIKYVQENEFTEVIEQLRNHTTVKLKSNLLNLNPFIDGNNILRVGGRLRHGDLSLNTKHPMIVPANNRLACLLIEQAHLQTFHGGPSLTLAHLRKEYWITGGLRIIKKHLRNCVTCKRNRPLKQQQLMGDLPEARVNPAPPFYHTGVDYTGFMDVKLNKGRGAKTTKGYVAVFICMVTKAVHLEIVSDLTSSAFMAALRRMAARRGTPAHIYSDNGTNFHGANNIMKQEYQQILKTFNNSFLSEVAEMGIKWHFNAPSWPSAGGIWERAVRSLKHHLKRVVGEQKLTFEEFATILSQVETCLNSRPLCALTEDTENLHVLTPAHFLTGRPGGAIIETAEDARSRWNLTNRIFQEMWNKWKSEYLTQLQARRKWMSPQQNIKLNDIVIIHEDNLPAGKWAIGRVIETHPGADGYVRVVTLQTQNGRIKRPVVKLSLLPITEKTDLNTNTDTEQPDQQRLKRQRVNRNCKKGTTLSTIVMGLLYFFTLLTNILGATVITELRQNQTLYFDHKAKLQLSRDQWTLVVYYDMSPYWEGNTAFDKMYQYLETSCNPANGNDQCNIIMQHLNHQFLEIKYYNQLLLNQLFHGHSRQRRGLLNGVGYLANSLFGVLDERFAEQYSTDINKIKQDQKHLYSLWKNQTSLVESEYNLLKRTESIISKHHKSINKQFNIIEKAVTDVEKQVSGQAQSINFALSAITAQSMLQTLKDIQETLLDTTTDLYQGHFNLHLLRPEQLKNELNTISGLLAADITLPIQNIQSDMRELYKLLRVRARMTENYFIFEIKIPLISRDTYDLYQVIPIPQRTENYTINIVPISNLIAINLQKDSFIPVSQEDFTNCLHKDILNIICILQSPVYKMKNDLDLCMKNEEKINECKINKVPCQNNWYSLSKANTYLYLCCAQCQIRTICKDLITAYQLSSPSLINADSNCIIKTNNFTVFTHQSQISTLNIEEKVETSFIAPINHIINISLEHYTTESIKINDKLSSQIEQKIKSLKEAELSTESNDLSFHDIHHYSLSYGIIGVIVLVGIVWSCRRVRRRRSRREAPAAATEPENAAQPAARASRSISMCQVNDISECDSARVRKFNSETELKVLKAEFVPKKLVFSED